MQWHRGESDAVGQLLRWHGRSSSELATLGPSAHGLRLNMAGHVLRPTLYCGSALPAGAHASRPRSRCACRRASSLRDGGLRAGPCGDA
jgi:hypothetical protein